MASAAEQMAANLSWGALGKATDLRQRIFYTIMVLMVYRGFGQEPDALVLDELCDDPKERIAH